MEITITWCTEDVIDVCPWLTEEQADMVLVAVQNNYDRVIGTSVAVLRDTADSVFPTAIEHKAIARALKKSISTLYGDDDSYNVPALSAALFKDLKNWMVT